MPRTPLGDLPETLYLWRQNYLVEIDNIMLKRKNMEYKSLPSSKTVVRVELTIVANKLELQSCVLTVHTVL